MRLPYRVIDADGHVLEHAVDWAARLPERFRKDAPGWVTLPDGDRHFIVERKPWPTGRDFYGALGLWPEPHKPSHCWSWEREGQWDPAKRLPDMDEEGIDVAVLFGTFVGLGAASSVENPELACAISEAYNNWLAEYCRYAPDRLKGIAILPLQDPAAARLELRRAVKELGMVGFVAFPNIHGRLLSEERFDPVWEEAQALDVPVCVHIVSTNASGIDRFDRYVFKHAFYPLDLMIAVSCFAAGGILERFPRLRVAFLEGGAGWVPWVMDRLHEHWELLPQQLPWQKRDPLEVMRSEQCFYSVEPEEMTIPYVAETVGKERLLYASDYSHWDCICPDSVKAIASRGDLSDGVKRKLLGENAARLFKL